MTEQSLTPSPVIESLLTGLGARAEVTDAVLGDLHQKLTEIAGSDGIRAARRWYRREALRAAPHLLLDGIRSLRFADARRLLNIGLLSATLTVMIAMMAFFAAGALIEVFTAGLSSLAGPGQFTITMSPILGVFLVCVILGMPVLTGFLAAAFEEKAPLLATLTVACGWTALVLLIAALQTDHSNRVRVDLALPVVGNLWVTIGCALGGLLRVGQGRQANA